MFQVGHKSQQLYTTFLCNITNTGVFLGKKVENMSKKSGVPELLATTVEIACRNSLQSVDSSEFSNYNVY